MANQRIRLAKYVGKTQRYRATFGEIRHDKNNHAEILLLDVYPVTSSGKKVPLRDKYKITGKGGKQVAADHVWVKLTQSFLKVPREVLRGDTIEFNAIAEPYKIKRDNVIKQRDKLWESGKRAADEVYQEYSNKTKKQLEILWHQVDDAMSKAYWAYKHKLLTYNEMHKEQTRLKREFQQKRKQAYRSMQDKQKRRIKRAQKQIAETDLVDYELQRMSHVQVVKYLSKYNKYRVQYDPNRAHELRYTKFLAAHSMAASNHTLKNWQN